MTPLDPITRRQHLEEDMALAALRTAVEQAERALSDDEGSHSVSQAHDAALDLAQAARVLLNELETRHAK